MGTQSQGLALKKMMAKKMPKDKEIGEGKAHEKSESKSFELKEDKGLVKDKADKMNTIKPEKGETKKHEKTETKKVDKTEDKIKTTGSFKGKPNKLGGGGRFAQLLAQGKSPALAAFIGRKKYGASKMASMAAKGK